MPRSMPTHVLGRLPLLLVLSLHVSACNSGTELTEADRQYPEARGNDIDAELLELAYTRARETSGINSLLVQRNGMLIAEEYFNGFDPDSLHDVRSVTKSTISILTGIALAEGHIESIDQPIGDFIAPLADSLRDEVAEIPLRYFLMMSSGLDWHELDQGSSYSDWWASDDMLQFVLDLPIVHAPGERFIYNTGASHLLSVVLTQATGMSTLDFAREHLFAPLGVSEVDWLFLPDGFYAGGMGLRITARTMMRMGQMFLDGGVYGGNQVVPADWVSESTRSHIDTHDAVPWGSEYGFLWWIGQLHGQDYYFANGYGGQFIVIFPELELVVVASSNWRGTTWDSAGEQWYSVLNVIMNGVLLAVN